LRILAAVRKAKPTLVVNGRLVRGAGDYDSTCDRPAEFPAHEGDWEGVPTTNESYGYNQNDHSHKPPAHFIQLLAKSAARGGNELMNIGPMGTGKMDPADIAILKGIGTWWQLNGESIRGTTRTPLAVQAWGESTLRRNSGPAGKDSTLYLHVFDWPRDGRLVIGGLKSEVKQAWLLRDKANTIHTPLRAVRVNPLDVRIEGLPKVAPDAADSVIVVDCTGEPQADPARLLARNDMENNMRGFDAKLQGKVQFGPVKKSDDWVTNWKAKGDAVVWPLRLNTQATFELALVYDAPKDSKGGKVKEGDAGKERAQASKGAGGTYVVKVCAQSVEHKVRSGANLRDALGKLTLEPGAFEIRVTAKEITGDELLRLRALILKPVAE
ncbi:MAG: alpha-L-fucosidase, partial [Kiritimatiellaeota bacterium]|nr:alpha-L-fucosidase [Kiritimatiellota bacterium]